MGSVTAYFLLRFYDIPRLLNGKADCKNRQNVKNKTQTRNTEKNTSITTAPLPATLTIYFGTNINTVLRGRGRRKKIL